MDTSTVASSAIAQSQASVGTAITQKAAELPGESVMILLAAVTQTQAAHNPPHLGNTIDIQA